MRRKMTDLRLLGAIRQSVTDDRAAARQDPATSPRRQQGTIERYASRHEHTVTVWAEDLDTSGSVPPWERPDLGKKLTDLDSYDAVIVGKLDRLSRSLLDFASFLRWLDEHGKSLIVIDPELDLTTHWGRAVAQILLVFAELELQMIRDRVQQGFEARQGMGRYSGMQFPFGYEPVPLTYHPDGRPASWGYTPSAKYAPVVGTIVDMLLAGKSLGAVVRWLEAEGIPTPRDVVREFYGSPLTGAHWRTTSVTKILMSDAILGVATVNGETRRTGNGLAVQRSEPIVDRDKLERVRRILKANADRTGPRINASPLLQIAFCHFCGKPLYINRTTYRDKVYRYYACPQAYRDATKCPGKRIDADWLESWLKQKLLAERGHIELTETRIIPATDHSEAMAAMAGAIGHLSSEIALGTARGEDVTALRATLADRQADLDHLAELPNEGPRTVTVKTGETWAQRWETSDASERNAFLRSRGIRIAAGRGAGDNEPTVSLRSGWHEPGDDMNADYLPVAAL